MTTKSSYALESFSAASMGTIAACFTISNIKPLIAEWGRRRWFRAELRRLLKVGPYMIDDIGLTYEEALDECEKPFWKP